MALSTFKIDLGAAVASMAQAFTASANIALQADDYVKHEFQQFIEDLDKIQTLLNEHKITPEIAQNLIDANKKSMDAVVAAAKGITLIAAQNAVNAALQALNAIVGAALSAALTIAV